MQKLTPDQPETASLDGVMQNLTRLADLFPEAFTEGKLDFDVLKSLLGDAIDDRPEKYGLNWHGKARARRHALTPTRATLRPDPASSVDWDTTQNLMIEGDNLEVLKLLQRSYAGKVKLIYIDPPYNTGKDFVYPDDYTDSLKNYQELTGQLEEGRRVSSNTESSGRFHTDWLNMMYPRLKLARELLREDGVIAISIDDNELANLIKVTDEIFGQENMFTVFPWQSRTSVQNDTDLSSQHESVVCFARVRRRENRRLKETNVKEWYAIPSFAAYPLPLNADRYDNPDNDSRGPWKADPFDAPNVRANLTYIIKNPNTGEEYYPPAGRCWRTEESSYYELLNDKRIVFGKTGQSRPQLKVFYREKKDFGETPVSWLDGSTYGTATAGTRELQELFDGESPFSFPKPTSLIKHLLALATRNNDIILDFFAGSGTTGHAVMAQNAADNGNRQFILVQLPEPLDPAKSEQKTAADFTDSLGVPRNIAELTKERLRRAGAKVKAENPMFAGDTGFRVFKLDSSNLAGWDSDAARADLEGTLQFAEDNIKAGRTETDVLYEVLLKLGLPLTTPIAGQTMAGLNVEMVGGGALVACLARTIPADKVQELGKGMADWLEAEKPAGEAHILFLDSAFENDTAKLNLSKYLEQRSALLKRNWVVRSL